ncbi:MAG: peptidoglycan DD-metalloendopeptidase family protein [Lachnospiraceae bacterium]|nr:peptidoglycan DD-metalloendopeptidase family protein [Lachnospiraceae bacterium]
MSDTEGSRRKRRFNYTLMIFADSKDGHIRQMGIGPRLIESLAVIVLTAITILSIICYREAERIEILEAETAGQQEEITRLTEENADLAALREELTDKVIILSDTINQKVEEEEALEQARAQAHMPVGFPMSSSASLEEADGENPMVKLNGAEGNSIIAAADGTVSSITTDSGYLHCIKIDHGNGYNSIYRNDGEAMVKEGDDVVRGAILYVIGEDNTELGYQITYDEKYIDPMDLINIDG